MGIDSYREVVLFIAVSLDGFIAGENDNLDFLSLVEEPGEDYGYKEFIGTVDTVIMGRKTYDKVRSFGIEFPHKDKNCYVFSRNRSGKDEYVTFVNSDIPDFVKQLRMQKGGSVYCDGGASIIHELLQHRLVDRIIVSIIPVLLGKGIKLFTGDYPEETLHLAGSASFKKGLVQLHYKKAVS